MRIPSRALAVLLVVASASCAEEESTTLQGSSVAVGSATASSSSSGAGGSAGIQYGLEWPGDGAVRRMLYWHDPLPIYDATYIFKVYPRKKTTGDYKYYTTFFW